MDCGASGQGSNRSWRMGSVAEFRSLGPGNVGNSGGMSEALETEIILFCIARSTVLTVSL